MILLLLVFKGIISFKYWWNYDYDLHWIVVMGENVDDSEQSHVLYYHKQLKLVGEDLYIVQGTNNWLVGKFIKDPISRSVYVYNHLNYNFDLIL